MQQQLMKSINTHEQVMEGSDIMRIVENDTVLNNHKFQELDVDYCDENLSVKELKPAIEDIGSALLVLPSHETSPQSDHIYSECSFLGMADGLKRDAVVILRIDGEDLNAFVKSTTFEPEIISIYSEIDSPEEWSLKDLVVKGLEKLTVEHGMPPATDPWVMSSVIEPALESLRDEKLSRPSSQETFVDIFREASENVVCILREQPAIVAHSQNTFDGSGIRRLLSNNFEFNKALDCALNGIPRDSQGKISRQYLAKALDCMGPFAGLPTLGAVQEMDCIMMEAVKKVDDDANDGESAKEEGFKKMVTEVLRSVMIRLEGDPLFVSMNSLVHEPITSSESLLQHSTEQK